MVEDALRYPTERDDWVKTIAIGGILAFLGFLLLPLFLVYGYLVRVVRAVTAGDPTPPAFEDWGDLLVDGLQAWVIGFVYLLVPIVVGAVTVGSAIVAFATGTNSGAAVGLASMGIGLLLTALLSLLFGYLAVAAIVNFAREERFGAGFEFGTIREVAMDRDYAIAWLTSVAIFFVAGIVGGMLGVVPILGAVLGAVVAFYAAVVAANLWATGFAEAREGHSVEESATEETVA